MIKCLSPNGFRLNGQLFRRHHGYQKLESRDKIQIGNVIMDFLLPFDSARKNEKKKLQREANNAKKRKAEEDKDGPDKKKLKTSQQGGEIKIEDPNTAKPPGEARASPRPPPPKSKIESGIGGPSKPTPGAPPPRLNPTTSPHAASLQQRILLEMKNVEPFKPS